MTQTRSALTAKAARAGRGFQGQIKVLKGRGMAGSEWTPLCHPAHNPSSAPGHCTVLTKHIQAHQSQPGSQGTAAEPGLLAIPPIPALQAMQLGSSMWGTGGLQGGA